MGDISPVLASFLAGQQGQTDLIKTAQGIAAQRDARTQRQQELDDIMKRFDISSKQEQSKIDLQTQIMRNSHDLTLAEQRDKLREGLANQTIPAQSTQIQGGIQIPSITNGQIPNQGEGDAPAAPINIPGISIPGPSASMVSPNQTAPDAFGGQISVPMPALASDIKTKEYMDTQGNFKQQLQDFKNDQLVTQLGMKDKQLEQQGQQFKERLDQAEKLAQMGILSKENLAESRMNYAMAARMHFRTPEQRQLDIKNNATGLATGKYDWSKIDPEDRAETREALNSMHMTDLPSKTANDIMERAGDASRFINVSERLKQIANNNGLGDQATNVVRNMIPFNLNARAAQFNGALQGIIPSMEKAQGLSLSRAGSSVPFQNQQKNITPRLTDTNDTIDQKITNGADIHLSALADKISNLSPEHQKLIWTDIVTQYPELMDHPVIGPKIAKAKAQGRYKVGLP